MKYYMFNAEVQQFQVHKKFNGEFNILRPEFFYQPYAGLPKKRDENSPLKNSAQIGLRLITKVYDNTKTLLLEFISESRCLLDYDDPANEKEVFNEFAQKAIGEHLRLFSEQVKKIGYSHSAFHVMSEAEKQNVFKILIKHFQDQF